MTTPRVLRALLLAGLAAIAALSGTSHAAQPDKEVRIGYQKGGTLALLRADGKLDRRLAQEGASVKWIEFPAGPQLLEALNTDSIDFGTTGEAPPVFAQAAGADLIYLANEPAAPAGEAIIVPKNSTIKTVADLKGKKVALNKGSNVHYLLVRALEQAGIAWRDIQPVYLAPADARAAFQNGNIDAWVIWDPYLAAAQKQLDARTIKDGAGLVDNYTFYLVRRPWVIAHPGLSKSVLDEIHAVDVWENENPAQAAKQLAPAIGLPEDITLTMLERRKFGVTPITPAVVAAQQKIADTFYTLKLIPKSLDIRSVTLLSGN